jgi:hypothetical protein
MRALDSFMFIDVVPQAFAIAVLRRPCSRLLLDGLSASE